MSVHSLKIIENCRMCYCVVIEPATRIYDFVAYIDVIVMDSIV